MTGTFADTAGDSGQYKILPVPQGGVKQTRKNNYVGHTVKDKNDQIIGTLNSVVLDTAGGNIVAGVVKIPLPNDRSALEAVPWNNVQIDSQSGEVRLKVALKDLVPSAVSQDVKQIIRAIEEQNQ